MSAEESVETASDRQKSKKNIRSQYKDVMVKIDEDIYYLDRLQLALKSGYFEKLFIEDYSDRNKDLIEIPLIDTDIFSAVVDVIYGEKVESVANADNFVSVLMAMDYLQMDIDSRAYEFFVNKELHQSKPLNKDILKFYNFIANDTSHVYLLPIVFQHLSEYLEELQNHQELLSIEFKHFTEIIMRRRAFKGPVSDTYTVLKIISKICARWICHDLKKRLRHMPSLLNAARFRCHLSNISCDDFDSHFSTNDRRSDENSVFKYFHKWLMYCGSVVCSNSVPLEAPRVRSAISKYPKDTESDDEYDTSECDYESDSQEEDTSFSFTREPKLKTFLENNNFCDITLNVGEKIYQLHRLVLKSESLYFEEMFSKEYSELIAQCKDIPNLPSKDKVYSINEIDSEIFDTIVDYLYLGKIEPTNDVIFRLLRAAHFLKIANLKQPCCDWLEANSEDICAEDLVEIVNFTYANNEYKELNKVFLNKYIDDSWPKIGNLPQFADLLKGIALPEGINMDENYAYLLEGVDQETFEVIINYFYFDKVEWTVECLAGVFEVCNMFKMEKLTRKCVKRLIWWKKCMSSSDVKKVLKTTLKNVEYYEVLNTVYLVQHMIQWPEVDIELFCSISYDCLENVLTSYDLYFNDASNLLDICSKWVVHDVENRYRLIPQIALAISRNRIANCDDYSITSPSDWNRCSQDFVKEEIWKILFSTSVLPFSLFPPNEAKKRKTALPVFIASNEGRLFKILDADLDEIVSFRLCENVPESKCTSYVVKYPMSATIINDNLFILCCMRQSCFFHAYNLSSQTLFALASDPRMFKPLGMLPDSEPLEYTLLNCRDEIYCCFRNGEVLKYSFELNRWMQFSSGERDKRGIGFASDGNELYRMYERARTNTTIDRSVEVYDFQQNSWVNSPSLPNLITAESFRDSEEYSALCELVFWKNYGLVALFRRRLFMLSQQTRVWQQVRSFPHEDEKRIVKNCLIIGQNEAGEMLLMNIHKVYRFQSADETWILKKEWPHLEVESSIIPFATRKILPYGNIIGIHDPKIHT